MPIILPDNPLPAYRVNPRFPLIYGPRKVGKTSQLIKIPNNLIIDLENGTDFVSGLKVKIAPESLNWRQTEITNEGQLVDGKKQNDYWTYPPGIRTPLDCLNDFKELCVEIRKHEPRKYRFVTIDTVDKIEEWALVLARKNYKASLQGKNFNLSDVTDLPGEYGPGYKVLREAFKEILQETLSLAEHVIFVGHVRDKLAASAATEADSKELDLIGKNRIILCGYCDAIAHMFRKPITGAIGLNFKSHENVLCGSRATHLAGKVFEFAKDIDWTKIFLPEV